MNELTPNNPLGSKCSGFHASAFPRTPESIAKIMVRPKTPIAIKKPNTFVFY